MKSICFVCNKSIAILAPEYGHHGAGGEEVQQALLAQAFTKLGYQTSMLAFDYGQRDGTVYRGVRTYKTYEPDAGIPGLKFFSRWNGLWSAAKRADADIYYISMSGSHIGQLAMFTQRHDRRLIFRIAHDANCDPAKVMLNARDRKLYEYGLRHADVILAQTRFQQTMLKKNYDLPSSIATMLVDFPNAIRELEERDIPVLWVNNLRQFKRPDLYMDLAAQLPFHLHMVGSPMPRFEDVYKNVVTRSSTLDNLTYHGAVPYHAVNDLYARARVFVNTSDTEGFPNSYLQSWARGTPVVAFFDPDDVIAREGLGIKAASLGEMRDAISLFLSDSNKWSAASRRCKSFMDYHYSDHKVLAPYVCEVERLR